MATDHILPPPECVICAKHRGEGPLKGELLGRRDEFWVYQAPAGNDDLAPLGELIIESDRHAPYLADLTDAEAAQLGRLRSQLAAALRDELGVELVFAAAIGRSVAHFHEFLVPRHAGIPAEVPWHKSDDAGPHADGDTVADLVGRLKGRVPGIER
jgi:ATP adenylyltransferase